MNTLLIGYLEFFYYMNKCQHQKEYRYLFGFGVICTNKNCRGEYTDRV